MPFRERMKKAFGRTGSMSDSSSLKKSNTNSSSYTGGGVGADSKAPQPKYRGPIDPNHKAHMEAFSFTQTLEGWRRKSQHSQYSPFGSRAPSRAPSRSGSTSVDPRKLFHARTPSHINKMVEDVDEGAGPAIRGASTAPTTNSTVDSSDFASTPGNGIDEEEEGPLGERVSPAVASVNGALDSSKPPRSSS